MDALASEKGADDMRSGLRSDLRRDRLTVIISGLGLLVLGLSVLVNPIGARESGVSMLGWILIIVGGLTLLSAVIQDGFPPRGGWCSAGIALLEIVPGIVMVAIPGALTTSAWSIMGLYELLMGIHTVLDGDSVATRLAGVFVAALGLVTVVIPFFGPVFGMLVAALTLVIDGIVQLVIGLRRDREPKTRQRTHR